MRIEDLKLFLRIAETRNLHRAADLEHLSQSALTKMLRRLETELGVKLFERAPRGVELTDVGRSFLKRVRQMNLQLDQALQEVADMRLAKLGVLRFGTSPALVDIVFTPAAQEFLGNRPRVHYELSIQHTSVLIHRLVEGRLDLILAALPREIPEDIDHEILFVQQIHVVARDGHPLQRLPPEHRAAALATTAWLLPVHGTIVRDWIERWAAESGLAPPVVAIETDAPSSTLSTLVRQTDLITTMSPEVMRSPLCQGLASLDGLVQPLEQPLALMWRRGAYLSPVVRDFWKVVENVVSLQRFAGHPGAGRSRGDSSQASL